MSNYGVCGFDSSHINHLITKIRRNAIWAIFHWQRYIYIYIYNETKDIIWKLFHLSQLHSFHIKYIYLKNKNQFFFCLNEITIIWALLSGTRLIRPDPTEVPEGSRSLPARIFSIPRAQTRNLWLRD